MIVNLSYKNERVKKEIDDLLGPSFSFLERLRRKGIGSGRFQIIDYSQAFSVYCEVDNSVRYAQFERRPHGFILRFRSRLETIGWILPEKKLSWERIDATSLKVESDDGNLTLVAAAKIISNFTAQLR